MKKKLLSLLTLLTLCVAGAWAETVVTNPTTEMVNGTYITMQCMDTNGGDEYYFDGNAVKSETRSFANIYKIVSNGADAFYLQRVSDSKYVGKSGDAISMVDETTSAAAFTFSIATATGWTTYDSNKYTNGTSTVRFTTSGTFLNTQAKAVIPKYAGGTGGYSIWYVKTYTQNEVDKMNPALLTFSEVKDGYTYALVNVQPTNSVGKNYYLNSTDGTLTPVDATGFNNTSEWPTTAQFVAEKHDGKFAFKNKENGQYLAWRSHNGGENSMKGFVSTIELWSAWTLNASGRGAGFEGTYWLSCDKRASATNGVGTLLIANNGSWNAANTEWTTSAYSNTYGFVELAAPTAPEYTITFNFTGVAEGTLTTTVRGGNVPTLPVAIPSYVNYEVSPTLAEVTGDATYTVTSSYGTMPFTPNNENNYNLNINRNPNLKVYTEGEAIKTVAGTAITYENQNNFKWQLDGDWLNGFTLKNKAAGKYVTFGSANPNDKTTATLTETPAEGAYFDFIINGGKNYFKIHGTTNNAYISNNGGATTTFLTNWNSTANIGDAGAQFIINEAQDIAFDLTSIKNAALATLESRIPALYTTADVEEATATINAVTCGSDQASIDAAIAAINAAKTAFMKKAEGKKVAIKSLGSYSTRGADYYLTSEAASTQMTSNTELTKNAVYELTFNEGTSAYIVKSIGNETYLPKTGNYSNAIATTDDVANAGFYTIIGTDEADQRTTITCINGNGEDLEYYRGIHLDGSKKIVVWGSNGAASKWNIETVTDEQWKELIWKDLENAITTAEQYTLGTGLGQYTPTSTSFITALLDAKDMLQTHKETPAEEASIEQVQQAIASIAVSQLSINQPQPGMLLHFKGNVGGKYVSAPEAESTAKANMVEGKDDLATVFTLNEDYQLISCTTGTGFINTGSIIAPGSETTPHTFTFSEGTVIGTYLVQSDATDGGQFWYASDEVLDRYNTNVHANKNFIIEEADEYAVADMEITEVGTATFCAPFDVEIPEGVTAYTATIADGSWVKLSEAPMLIENGKLEAGTPVVLKGAPMHKTFIDVIDEDFINTDLSSDGSCLTGNLKEPRFVDAGKYLLQNQTAVAGLAWYKIATSGVLKIGTNRCYMTLTSGQNAREYFPMDFDDPTGINTIATEAATKADGKYLVKGQIVVVKAGKAYTTAGQLIK